MRWFANLSFRAKIAATFGFMTLFLFAIVIYSYRNIDEVRLSQKELADKFSLVQNESLRLKESLAEFRIIYLSALVRPDQSTAADLQAKLETSHSALTAILTNITKTTASETRYKDDINRFSEHLKNWKSDMSARIVQLQQAKPDKKLDSLVTGQESFEGMIKSASNIWALSQQDIREGYVAQNEQTIKTIMIFFGANILFFFLSLFFIKQANKFLADPLLTVADISEEIAAGDIYQDLPETDRHDEIGKLYASFTVMLASLKELARAIAEIGNGNLNVNLNVKSDKDLVAKSLNATTGRLRTVIADSKDGTEVVSGSTNKIFGAVSQLSASSNQTAAAIGQTTVTIDQVKKTSEMLSKKAREISAMAQKASAISENGMKTTEDTMQGIQDIGTQMEIIGESIIKLTEQSRAIGDIIASVNDLAEQSNLLAVNAAIEAARAGEHGKSFVVVAQEIKSLAQQSKQATGQVKSVLNDIQNAINATVLATEQGEKIVSAGIARSRQTRESIQTLAETITMFTDISMQTSASSQEQYIGMEQVAIAMDNIKVASTQNAVISRDLEQSARNLQLLTERLREAIAVFQVD